MGLGVACSINYCALLLPYSLFSFHFFSGTKKGRKEGKYFGCGRRKKKKKKGGGGRGKEGKCVDEERNNVYLAYFILVFHIFQWEESGYTAPVASQAAE